MTFNFSIISNYFTVVIYYSTDKILNCEQPHATVENAKECCIRCTEKLMSENKILSL